MGIDSDVVPAVGVGEGVSDPALETVIEGAPVETTAEPTTEEMKADYYAKKDVEPATVEAATIPQDLVKDYKKTRQQSQVLYYSLQLSTIIFSGVTPILVLVDKLETGQPWLKWLPVICSAIASIVASIVTSFPFQELSIAANTTVELLEAEQEKFILGVGQSYRAYDATSDNEEQQKSIQAIENFIIEVNNIHLKQVQQQKNQNESSVNTTSEASG